ncbi:periaxin [Python bivittatus]|uniref:Periaxin n=1 Tax=Python bivittatus TaxID=176946 RepID=A0A9F2R1V2_PYTBI|nr:periaxin [Python bivittatus]
MAAQLVAMEKTIEASELLEMVVETEAEAGARGLRVAGGGKQGLFVKDVLKDSPAARVLSLQEGDQLLSARVFFDNIKYEDALQILKCAEPYKISFCLKRVVPSADVSRKPGTSTFEVRGPKAKMAKLNIQSLSSLKRRKKKKKRVMVKSLQETEAHGSEDLASGKLEITPVDVEFSLPKFSKLRKAKSAGEVAVAEPSPDISLKLSSLETKRHKLKFPRLKVKEAAAARMEEAVARLDMGLPKVGVELKEAGKGGVEGKTFRFTIPFPKTKKPKEEAGAKMEMGFQAPQVELSLPLPKMGPDDESLKAGTKGERIPESQFGLAKVEAALPKVSASALEIHEGVLQAGLKLPTAEVVAPKVDVDLALPKLECVAPEVAPKREGFRIKVPKFGISAEEAELKLPLMKAPALEMALGESREKAEDLEDKLKPGVSMPSLEVVAPGVDLELPLPKGKTDMESPEISVKVPSVRLPKLGSKAQEEGEGKLPQVEISIGKLESPKADKMKGSIIQIPSLEISLMEQQLESEEVARVADDSKVKFPEMRMPSLGISAPKVQDIAFPKAMGDLAAPCGRAKPKEAAEGAGFKFQMPQISLPKFDLPVKAAPSPPPVHVKMLKPEGDVGAKVNLPKVDFSLSAVKMPGVQLPKVPKPELDISVEKPKVEVTVPPARLSFPSATVPALDIELPKVGVELDLAKAERDTSEQVPKAHEVTLETVGKGLGIEISIPKCQMTQPELEPRMRAIEGPTVTEVVARIPKVDLAFEKQPADTEGAEPDLEMKGKLWPKTDLEVGGFAPGAKMKLPTVEIPAVSLPEMTVESQAKLKSSRFSLSKFGISGPKVWSKTSPEVSVSEVEGAEAADLGSRLKFPKFGISFPRSKRGAEVEDAKLALEAEGQVPKERLDKTTESRMKLPMVDVDIGHPQGKEEWSGMDGEGAPLELPGVKFKGPKFSLPRFGGKGKEEEWGSLESGEGKLQGGKEGLAGRAEPQTLEKSAKASKFRVASLGLMRREVEGKAKKVSGSPKEEPRSKLGKMPKLKHSSLKAEEGKGKFHLPAPQLDVKVLPQAELPKPGARAETGLISELESPSFRVQLPSVEIAVPSPKTEGEVTLEKLAVDVSRAETQCHEGELKILRVPSVDVSAPTLELDIGLPMAGKEEGILLAAPSTDAKIKLPKAELAKLGKGEDGGTEAAMQLLGHRLGFGKEGEKDLAGVAEASALGTKIRLPKVDISLPKAWMSDVELPLGKVELGLEGPEAKFNKSSAGLPKFSTPKVKPPELELDVSLEGGMMPKVKVGAPSVKWPQFGTPGSEGEGEGEENLPRVPQLELKAPKLRGSTEALSSETGAKEGKYKMPALPLGLGKLETEAGMGTDESKFKLKLPSLSISKPDVELSIDTQPLCPPAEEPELTFKIPQVALPEIRFSAEQEEEKEARVEAGKVAGMADLEVDVGGLEGMLKMPKIGMPAFGAIGTKGGTETTTQSQRGAGGGGLEGNKSVFKVPGLEISTPSLKTHAEYEVEGAHIRQRGPLDLEGPGRDGWKRTEDHSNAEAGKRYKVKIPKFGLFLPKAGLEAPEGLAGEEAEAKRGLLALGRPKEKGTEGSSELLKREEESEAKRARAKLKPKPTFGLSLSKPKLGAELNGEVEEVSSKLKVPKLGFSKAEVATQLNGERVEVLLQEGASKLGKIRLPQVELLSPSKVAETDPELNLKLVKADEAKEEAHRGSTISTALKAAKFKSPRITLSGFKKRNGELAPEATLAPLPHMETGSLGTPTKGESSTKFRFPKLALSSRSQGVLEISEHQQDQGGLNFRLPAVAFSAESSPHEVAEDPRRPGEKEAAAAAAAL